jgi:hypothetical protein
VELEPLLELPVELEPPVELELVSFEDDELEVPGEADPLEVPELAGALACVVVLPSTGSCPDAICT